MPASDIRQLFAPGGAAELGDCPLIDMLLTRIRPRFSRGAAGDEPSERLSELFLLIDRLSIRADGAALNVGYLAAAAGHAAVEDTRKQHGRVRCGNCRWYGSVSRLCLRRGAPYVAELAPACDPRALEPPCGEFASARSGRAELDGLVDGRPDRTIGERLEHALERLKHSDAGAAALIFLHHLEGRSLRALARESGCDRRFLGERLRSAEERLGYLLEDMS